MWAEEPSTDKHGEISGSNEESPPSQMDFTPADTSDDQQLIARLRAGDISAFTTIVRTYSVRLEEYVRRQVGDSDVAIDIVQDVFMELWERRARADIRTTLQGYIYGSAHNHVRLFLRRVRLEERCETDFIQRAVTPGTGAQILPPDALLEQQELAGVLDRALETLSPRVRQVALLRWRDKLSRAEIASIVGVAVSTIHNQLTTAARALRPLLAEHRSDYSE